MGRGDGGLSIGAERGNMALIPVELYSLDSLAEHL
jgi:hypothetical protein